MTSSEVVEKEIVETARQWERLEASLNKLKTVARKKTGRKWIRLNSSPRWVFR